MSVQYILAAAAHQFQVESQKKTHGEIHFRFLSRRKIDNLSYLFRLNFCFRPYCSKHLHVFSYAQFP